MWFLTQNLEGCAWKGDWLSNEWSTKRNPDRSGVDVAWEARGRLPIVAFWLSGFNACNWTTVYKTPNLGSSDRGKKKMSLRTKKILGSVS
jgi:hypothetical protein